MGERWSILMSNGRSASEVRSARKETGMTQLALSMDLHTSREAVSKQENGEYRVQPDLVKYFAESHNNPFVGMTAAAEYTGWGSGRLDGEDIDLHRSSVKCKAQEELQEALIAINKTNLVNHPRKVEPFQFNDVKESVIQAMDAIIALNHYIAVICKEYSISWAEMWLTHKKKLISRGYMKG